VVSGVSPVKFAVTAAVPVVVTAAGAVIGFPSRKKLYVIATVPAGALKVIVNPVCVMPVAVALNAVIGLGEVVTASAVDAADTPAEFVAVAVML